MKTAVADEQLVSPVRRLRQARGWTQRHLARLADISESDMSKIETGRIRAYRRQLERLANVLGVSPEETGGALLRLPQRPDVELDGVPVRAGSPANALNGAPLVVVCETFQRCLHHNAAYRALEDVAPPCGVLGFARLVHGQRSCLRFSLAQRTLAALRAPAVRCFAVRRLAVVRPPFWPIEARKRRIAFAVSIA